MYCIHQFFSLSNFACLEHAHTSHPVLWTDTTAVIWFHSWKTQKAKQEAVHTHFAHFLYSHFWLRSYWRGRWLLCGGFFQKQKCLDRNKWFFFQNFSNHPFKSQTLISLCTNMTLIHTGTHARLLITHKHLHSSEALKLADSDRSVSSWYAEGVRKPDGGRGFIKMVSKHQFSCGHNTWWKCV